MAEIIPAILPKNYDELEGHLSEIVGLASVVQIDVCDGVFTAEKSWPYNKGGWEKFEALTKEQEGLPFWQDFDFEVHLMVADPESEIEKWIVAGATRIIVHVEAVKDFGKLTKVLDGRAELGLALNLETSAEKLEQFLGKVDFVLLMAIGQIGQQGEKFDEKVLDKIKTLRSKYSDLVISVDGGVKIEIAKDLIKAGVSRLVVGSAIFSEDDPRFSLRAFQKLAAEK